MLTRRFVTATHVDNPDIYGLKPLWLDPADPMDGIGCAHDMIEHGPSDKGGCDGEFIALGSSWRIRGANGWYLSGRNMSAEKLYGGTVASVLFDLAVDHAVPGHPGATRPLEEHDEDSISTIIDEAILIMMSHDEDDRVNLPESEIRARITGFLRRGIRLADRRYRSVNIDMVENTFNVIGRKVDAVLGHFNKLGRPEGLNVSVSANVAMGCAFVRVLGPGNSWINEEIAFLA